MANPNKAKGTRWEVSVATFLRERGFTEVFRLAPGGEHDAGDIGGLPNWAIDLAKNVRDAEMRAVHKGCRWGVAILKKRGSSVREGYVVMSLDQFAEVLTVLEGNNESNIL